MSKIFAHLRSERGESLVESIVAFAVITAILVAFAAFVTLGSNLSSQTTQLDSNASESINANVGSADVSIDGTSVGTVNVYKNNANVYRYQ